jgi:perosamine synthetase
MKVPLIKPFVTQEVKDKVCEVLESGYLTEGPVTHEFEAAVRSYVGCGHAVATTSCTTGLEMALRCLGIGPGDEVIVPDYTYPATASVVSIVGATVVIVDVDPSTLLIDYAALEAAITPRTRAVIPVSLFGNPLDFDRLTAIKQQYKIFIVEDAACALGASFKGVRVGNLADISVFSLHPRKFITTGEGGMVTTNDDDWAAWLESYKHFGMARATAGERVVFERIGTNYKLSNVQAAIGLVQMRHIDELLARRLELADRYVELFGPAGCVQMPVTTPGGAHSRQTFCVLVHDRDRIMKMLRQEGMEVQIGTYALHMHPAFADRADVVVRGDMAGACLAYDRCLSLPLFHDLRADEQAMVASRLMHAVQAPRAQDRSSTGVHGQIPGSE